MKALDLEGLTISEIAPLIRKKQISPLELTRRYLDRIRTLNPLLNAYLAITEDSAIATARKAEREITKGNYRGPLHGIPFSIKDNIAVKGVTTTAGSKILSDWVPDFDATVVEKLKEAGVVILGKTNMHEWAKGSNSINPFYGTSRNPWDTTRVPGGSSGGSAVAVAASLCLASLGTDSAGSVRNPASLCGTVGLKPTLGRISSLGQSFELGVQHVAIPVPKDHRCVCPHPRVPRFVLGDHDVQRLVMHAPDRHRRMVV